MCVHTSDGTNMESLLRENRVFQPPVEFAAKARIGSVEQYDAMYKRSVEQPEEFWAEAAGELEWFAPWTKVLDGEMGSAKWFTGGMPVSMLTDDFAWIGSGANPVYIFLTIAVIFHIVLRYTRFGKFTYAIGANRQAARVSGINVNRHLVYIYTIAGLLSGIAGSVTAARAISGQSGMGVMYELDAIAAVVIGGTSLVGGLGRITGTVIGVLILGVMMSGFTFIRIDAYYQEMVKGAIIVVAVIADQYRNKKRGR